jgi:hypothetical protein
MEVSGQLHAPAPLPPEKSPPGPIVMQCNLIHCTAIRVTTNFTEWRTSLHSVGTCGYSRIDSNFLLVRLSLFLIDSFGIKLSLSHHSIFLSWLFNGIINIETIHRQL